MVWYMIRELKPSLRWDAGVNPAAKLASPTTSTPSRGDDVLERIRRRPPPPLGSADPCEDSSSISP